MSAIVAKAINSTIGTPDFKGLDEILRDNKIFVPSDRIYAPVLTSSFTVPADTGNDLRYTPSGSIRFNTSGVICLLCKVSLTDSQGIYVSAKINGVNIKGATGYAYTAGANATDLWIEKIITVKKGDVLSMMCSGTTGAALKQVYICAEIEDCYYAVQE